MLYSRLFIVTFYIPLTISKSVVSDLQFKTFKVLKINGNIKSLTQFRFVKYLFILKGKSLRMYVHKNS